MSLPSGYKKIEYIQSSGTQYIDTGFKPNQNTRLIADVEILNVPHSQLVGARIASGNASFNILVSSKTDGRDDYNETALNFAAGAARWKIDKNKNVTTVNGTAVSHPAGTFQTTCSIFINAVNTNGSPMSTTTGSAKWRSVQIYDNGRLVRDFIPCKTAAGVVGLWDDVNNTFYSNAGSGTFTAGPEAIGSNRVLVDAKGYDANSGTVLVNGMVYHLKKGRGLLNGMGYDIPFAKSVTWYLNSVILNKFFNVTVSFTSNGRRFSRIQFSPGIDPILLYYLEDGKNYIEPYVSGWSQPVYRTITFDEEPTGDLLTWLEDNGTRQ